MSMRFDKNWKRVRRNIDDLVDEAGDVYGEVKHRASRAWRNRDDYVDEVVSVADSVADVLYARFRADPVGTIAVGAIVFWLAGKLVRR